MKLFMEKCNYDFTIEHLVINNNEKFKKTNLSDEELNLLYEYYEKLYDLTQDELKHLEKLQRKDQATKEMVIRIKKFYFNKLFNKFEPEIFHKLYCDSYNKHIIKNLYAEKNKTILDEMVEDITQSNGYAEFIRHRSSKLYYIQECNKLLNIEHSNVEVETISIEDISGLKDFVIKNKKDIQIAYNMTCSRDVDIINNIYSKWSNTDFMTIYKDKLKKTFPLSNNTT